MLSEALQITLLTAFMYVAAMINAAAVHGAALHLENWWYYCCF